MNLDGKCQKGPFDIYEWNYQFLYKKKLKLQLNIMLFSRIHTHAKNFGGKNAQKSCY